MQDNRSKFLRRNAKTTTNCFRHQSRLRSYAVAICLAAILPLTGCTSSPTNPSSSASTPSTSSQTPTTPTATSEPSTSPPTTTVVYKPATAEGPAQNVPFPVLPAKAREFSKEGLLSFAEYWYSTLGYAFETGDPGPMMEISDADCKSCLFINEPLEAWYKNNGWVVGGQMTVHSSTSTFNSTSAGTYQAILMIQQAKVTFYNADGSLAKAHPQRTAQANIVVATYTADHWTARTAEFLTKD